MRAGKLLAIDPDPNGGSWVLFNSEQNIIAHGYQDPIEKLTYMIEDWVPVEVVVEGVQSYGPGVPVGKSIFETCYSIGEIRGACRGRGLFEMITRPKVKRALLGTIIGNDTKVRAALVNLYGGEARAVGIKSTPGPLCGVKYDIWAALAVGVVWLSLRGLGPLALRDGAR